MPDLCSSKDIESPSDSDLNSSENENEIDEDRTCLDQVKEGKIFVSSQE